MVVPSDVAHGERAFGMICSGAPPPGERARSAGGIVVKMSRFASQARAPPMRNRLLAIGCTVSVPLAAVPSPIQMLPCSSVRPVTRALRSALRLTPDTR